MKFNLEARIRADLCDWNRASLLESNKVDDNVPKIKRIVSDAIEACIPEREKHRHPPENTEADGAYVNGWNLALRHVRNRKDQLIGENQ